VRVTTDLPEVVPYLRDLEPRADDDWPPGEPLEFRIAREDGRACVRAGPVVVSVSEDPAILVRDLHLYLYSTVMDGLRDHLRLHAASGSVDGRFFLLSGYRGAGKTTLLLRLLLDGADAHGDENVLVKDGRLRTFPRRFYLKHGTLDCLPELRAACAGKRRYPGFYGGWMHYVDPTDVGRAWRSAEGLPYAAFHLEPDFGAEPRLEPCAKTSMVQHLLGHALNLERDTGGHIASLCRALAACRCHTLRVGDLAKTAALVRGALA